MVAVGGRGSLEPGGRCTWRLWCKMNNRDARVLFSDEFNVRVTNQAVESVRLFLYSILNCFFIVLLSCRKVQLPRKRYRYKRPAGK